MMSFFAKTCIAAFALAFYATVHAQVPNIGVLTVTATPEFPGARTEVKLTLDTSSVDLNRSTVSWTVGGRRAAEGRGIKTLTVTTGAFGSSLRISATATSPEGRRVVGEITLRPADVDLLWEADTYTPPFYRGKALPSSGSALVITAFPHFVLADGTRVRDNDVIYTWSKNRRVLGGDSGFGKQTLALDGPERFFDAEITVKASSLQGTFTAQRTIRLAAVEPRVLLYRRHPLLGVLYERSLGGTEPLAENELTVRVEPYYFSRDDRANGLQYSWELNDEPFLPPQKDTEVVFRSEGGTSGSARVGVSITNAARIFQRAAASLFITFGQSPSL
ncbi:MAG: hypothetical protein HYS74_00930 [Parcubacteria group bacterium]|nr:hypothetical protein [Parcubacteria group bacterium]